MGQAGASRAKLQQMSGPGAVPGAQTPCVPPSQLPCPVGVRLGVRWAAVEFQLGLSRHCSIAGASLIALRDCVMTVEHSA